MGLPEQGNATRHLCIGLLAHVDAGKTTLSEGLLFRAGVIRRLGRVDHRNTFLDTFEIERQRGITIFSKQAVLRTPGFSATLLDTPGHVDFAAEMERTLEVLDCAILVVSAPEGIQSHTMTVWQLLRKRRIPTFLFVNKMDLPGADRAEILRLLNKELGGGFADFSSFDEEVAASVDEELIEQYLATGHLERESLRRAVAECRIFPTYFGAALKLEGVDEFLAGLEELAPGIPAAAAEQPFGAKVFKISRDDQGARLTHLKVTSGRLRVREQLEGPDWKEKVTGLRLYSGAKFTPVEELGPGEVGAVVGLSRTAPGLGLGVEAAGQDPTLEPALIYRLLLPPGMEVQTALPKLRQLEEEEPQLKVEWDERLGEIRLALMGQVQLEIITQLLKERFDMEVSFDEGSILYRETIAAPVEGVGHYEPLRHYAEVHLLLEPGQRGSGLRFATACSEDELGRNFQHLVLTHLREKQHLGVLTGSPITDLTITLMSGRAHVKHTEGGDFRQATWRAVRQGLMQAESVLLEPWYDFTLTLPSGSVGRALTDLQRMGAEIDPPMIEGDDARLTGSGPVAALRGYHSEVLAYTRGVGRFVCTMKGYAPCADPDPVIEAIGYRAENDLANPADSVFCSHGAGVTVKWNEVEQHMHLPSVLAPLKEEEPIVQRAARYAARVASDKELMAIFERTYGPIRRDERTALRTPKPVKKEPSPQNYRGKAGPTGPEYLLIDGYNIIHAWDDLRALAEKSLDLARSRLIDRLCSYQGYRQTPVILVFDAWRVKGNPGSVEQVGGLSVVYTKEAETADMYIEKVTHEIGRKHRVRVATSDGLEQIIILSHGALRVSAGAFRKEVEVVEKTIALFLRKN
ncbi:MAG: TetM/TetW/TetO/TetS family tetracycline resistance ribosomal protection protein [Clostridia bacterium]|nr:TetM/TetW/TetO/TetS family tetracycline resistance ribosomal protection protein [Clostridia bacterium]